MTTGPHWDTLLTVEFLWIAISALAINFVLWRLFLWWTAPCDAVSPCGAPCEGRARHAGWHYVTVKPWGGFLELWDEDGPIRQPPPAPPPWRNPAE